MALPIALVADKDSSACQHISGILKTSGVDSHRVHSIAEAMAALVAVNYQYLFTALRFDDGDGITLIADARRIRPGIPIAVVSRDTAAESVIQALRLGVCDYIFKPVSAQKILSALARAKAHSAERSSPHSASTQSVQEPPPLQLAEPSPTVTVELSGDLRSIERQLVKEVIWRCDGNKAAAARLLGMHRRTLYRMLEQETAAASLQQ